MQLRPFLRAVALVLLPLAIVGCGTARPEPQPPIEYLGNALDWIESNSVLAGRVDFAAIRRESLALVPAPQSTTDTYPALRRALTGTLDALAWLQLPQDPINLDPGLFVTLPELVITEVAPGGPASRAGIHAGDRLLAVNGAAPRPQSGNPADYTVEFGPQPRVRLTLQREGQNEPIEVTLERDTRQKRNLQASPSGRILLAGTPRVAYLDLVDDDGSGPYPGLVHRIIQGLDRESVCGWVIDLRHNIGGDIWSFIAAIGPLLGEGNVGGFVYADGRRDTWSYRGGKVFWNNDERGESFVQDGIYTPHNPAAPVALLTSYTTIAAGELVVVAFEGRPEVRVFGEPTRGLARLVYHTPLSDGAEVYVSGAYATDRAGKVYDGPIQPDEFVKTDWTKYGTDEDPVVRAAAAYLAERPGCKGERAWSG